MSRASKAQLENQILSAVSHIIGARGDQVEHWFWVNVATSQRSPEEVIAQESARRLQAYIQAPDSTSVPANAKEWLELLQDLSVQGGWLTKQRFHQQLYRAMMTGMLNGTIRTEMTTDFTSNRNYTLSIAS